MTEDNHAAAPAPALPGQRIDVDEFVGQGAPIAFGTSADADGAELEDWAVRRSLANPTRLRLGIRP